MVQLGLGGGGVQGLLRFWKALGLVWRSVGLRCVECWFSRLQKANGPLLYQSATPMLAFSKQLKVGRASNNHIHNIFEHVPH